MGRDLRLRWLEEGRDDYALSYRTHRLWCCMMRSLFWLTYNLGDGSPGVLIQKAGTLLGARMLAAIDGLDQLAEFVDGHELYAQEAPPDRIGRMLLPDEAHRLLVWVEAEGLRKKLRSKAA